MNPLLQQRIGEARRMLEQHSEEGELPWGSCCHVLAAFGEEVWVPKRALADRVWEERLPGRESQRTLVKRFLRVGGRRWQDDPRDVYLQPGETPIGHRRRTRLALCTTASLLPFWERFFPESLRPHVLLLAAERFLAGALSFEAGLALREWCHNASDASAEADLWEQAHGTSLEFPPETCRAVGTMLRSGLSALPDTRAIPVTPERGAEVAWIYSAAQRTLAVALLDYPVYQLSWDEFMEWDGELGSKNRERRAALLTALPAPNATLRFKERETDVFVCASHGYSAATSARDETPSYDPERRRVFWDWWLTHTVPYAYRSVSSVSAENTPE